VPDEKPTNDRPPGRDRDRDRPEDDDRDDRPRRPRRDRDDGEVLGGLIPLKNGMALAAYYCGVFSFIPCLWGTLSVLAVVFGFIGLSKAKRHPSAKGKGHAIAGIVCGSITGLLGLASIAFVIVSAATKR
jgi:hypothetical protein